VRKWYEASKRLYVIGSCETTVNSRLLLVPVHLRLWCRSWGLILGTLGRQGNPRILQTLKGLMEEAGCSYTLVYPLPSFPIYMAVWVQYVLAGAGALLKVGPSVEETLCHETRRMSPDLQPGNPEGCRKEPFGCPCTQSAHFTPVLSSCQNTEVHVTGWKWLYACSRCLF